ncbi:MAG: hypothetical protein M1819_001785 [Sarea resinae]|nr:MAG: hypothetical protein M1819_001785 [Sarea resinae]
MSASGLTWISSSQSPESMMNGTEILGRSFAEEPRGLDNGEDAGNTPGKGTPGRRYPHIKDLAAQATSQVDPYMSIGKLLQYAEQSAKQADSYLDFRRPDLAYVEYLRASHIMAKVIPTHKDAPSLNGDRGTLWRLNKAVIKKIDSQHPKFDHVKEAIIEDNLQSGVQPKPLLGEPLADIVRSGPSPRPLSFQAGGLRDNAMPLSNGVSTAGNSRTPSPPRRKPVGAAADRGFSRDASSHSPAFGRAKPAASPKPERLLGRAASLNERSSSNPTDILAERFAKLRNRDASPGSSSAESSNGQPSVPALSHMADLRQDKPSNVTPPRHLNLSPQPFMAASGTSPPRSGRIIGPRSMPTASGGPPHPPKVPLDTQFVVPMPRAPSPTYSPARNLPSPASINPPRTSARSIIGTGGRTNSIASSSAPSHSPVFNGDSNSTNSYFPKSSYESQTTPTPERSSEDLPRETVITAEKLYDYLKLFNILLVDVRSREDFDRGHIFAQSVMCIEPAALRIDMSAEELEERLVISPDVEQALFERRDQFDLVVYYGQSTSSNQYLSNAPSNSEALALKALHAALYEFSFEKHLRRPPILLAGGLEAWIDLVGAQALSISDTMSSGNKGSIGPGKKSRPIGRVPMASTTSSLQVKRQRVREYNPLNAEEERAWLEQARTESGPSTEGQEADTDQDVEPVRTPADEAIPIVHNYEEFLRRFPEPQDVQQSMSSPPPPQPLPIQPAYHESPSNLPTAPSRPPPAVPRTSYSGVSERSSLHPGPPSRPANTPAPPLYDTHANNGTMAIKLPRTGLMNFSVTCYMNAIIQCLNATIPLSKFFLSGVYRGSVQRNWKGSQGVMPEFYANLVRSLWKGDYEAIRPLSFRNFCARLNREWGIERQQDAKEFFDFLIDCLHEDLNINWSRTPLRQLTAEQEMKRERMPMHLVSKVEWDRYCHRESSFISSLFAGQHASRLQCTTCKRTSTTYEAFYSISVEIPRSGAGNIRDCLRSYCQEERLSGDEVWKCPHCKCEREATKQITITRAPQFLVIHFKRFSASKTERARKVRTPIDFPLHGLNLEPFMIPPITPEVAQEVAATYPTGESLQGDAATTPPYLYDAYAVLRHHGSTLNSGHYIALARDGGRQCWRSFNDHRVDDFIPTKLPKSERLQNELAYIVFYVRSSAR